MQTERIVRLFRNGRNQAVRIPRDLELTGNEALLRKEGDRLNVELLPRRSLLEILATWDPLKEEFPEIETLEPVEGVNLEDGPLSPRHEPLVGSDPEPR